MTLRAEHWSFTQVGAYVHEVQFEPRPDLGTYRLTTAGGQLHLFRVTPAARNHFTQSFGSAVELTEWLGGRAGELLPEHRKVQLQAAIVDELIDRLQKQEGRG